MEWTPWPRDAARARPHVHADALRSIGLLPCRLVGTRKGRRDEAGRMVPWLRFRREKDREESGTVSREHDVVDS
jgi:hypothetical protein